MTKESKQEYTLRISQANKTQMVVIIYEMLLDYLDECTENLKKDDDKAFRESIRKATGCIRELSASVNPSFPAAGNILGLNNYCNKELAMADLHKDPEKIEGVRKIMKKLCDAYKESCKNDDSAPVMNNSQSVYAGLTYGKESLIVNLNDTGNRGFTI